MPHSKIRYAAVAIRREARRQMHVAVLYVATDKSVRALHYCQHLSWQDELAAESSAEHENGSHFFWVQPAFRESLSRSVAAICRLIADRKSLGVVPYGFNFDPTTHFDRSTGALVAPHDQGLTCSTFVLAVLTSYGIKVIDFASWPERPCDVIWQRHMATRTKLPLLPPQVGAPRFRPEEVVSACVQSNRPAPSLAIIRDGRDVLNSLGAAELACSYGL